MPISRYVKGVVYAGYCNRCFFNWGQVMKSNYFKSAVLLGILLLTGCGKAHVKADTDISNLRAYQNIYIADVVVNSKEQVADLISLNEQTAIDIKNRLQAATCAAGTYNLVESNAAAVSNSINVATQVDIVYGSRAKRYFLGFGAGKGYLTSTLTVTDNTNGTVVFSLLSKSDIKFGITGGDMRVVLTENADKLVNAYTTRL